MRSAALEDLELFLPVGSQFVECRVDLGGIGVLGADFTALRAWSHAEQKQQSRLFPWGERQPLVQCSAVIAAQLRAAMTGSLFQRNRVCLGAVVAQKFVAKAVIAVGREVGGEVMKGPGLVKEIVFDDAVREARSRGIEAHLQVLVVDLDVMEGKLDVTKDADPARPRTGVLDLDVPQLDVVANRNEECLLGQNLMVIARKLGVRKSVAALILCFAQVFADGLPRDRPVLARVVIAKIDIMSGAIERNAVLPEARDALMLSVLVERIAAGIVRDDGAQVL